MKPQQQTVRVGGLERTLESFNAEQAVKIAQGFITYHSKFIAPLEQRIAQLEQGRRPAWERLLTRLWRGK